MSEFKLPKLPPEANLETVQILKQLSVANRALAELKGVARTIPNSDILINTLVLQEAKDSSEIENIITTHDDLYKSDIDLDVKSVTAKEVKYYSIALKHGFELIKQNELLTANHIVEIQKILEQNDAGIRTQSGTVLKNLYISLQKSPVISVEKLPVEIKKMEGKSEIRKITTHS